MRCICARDAQKAEKQQFLRGSSPLAEDGGRAPEYFSPARLSCAEKRKKDENMIFLADSTKNGKCFWQSSNKREFAIFAINVYTNSNIYHCTVLQLIHEIKNYINLLFMGDLGTYV